VVARAFHGEVPIELTRVGFEKTAELGMGVHTDEGRQRADRPLGGVDDTGRRARIRQVVFVQLCADPEPTQLLEHLERLFGPRAPRLRLVVWTPTGRAQIPAVARQGARHRGCDTGAAAESGDKGGRHARSVVVGLRRRPSVRIAGGMS
jgi:hypothetical protein